MEVLKRWKTAIGLQVFYLQAGMNCTDVNREFQCNSLLVKALLQFLSATERKKAHEWLQKLDEVGDELPEAKIRNEYVAYLLINVQKGFLQSPFNLVPPCKKLRPLSGILLEHEYEDAMKQFKMNFCFMAGLDCESEPPPKLKSLTANPPDFHQEQPRPHKGIIAYCSAFSNYDE